MVAHSGYAPDSTVFQTVAFTRLACAPYGQNERIRTSDPLIPSQALYQAELHSENKNKGLRVILKIGINDCRKPYMIQSLVTLKANDGSSIIKSSHLIGCSFSNRVATPVES